MTFALTITDFTNVVEMQSIPAELVEPITFDPLFPLQSIWIAIQKLFFLAGSVLIVPELTFVGALFSALSVPMIYIIIKALPFT